ncbi:unnamed protein product [Prorocentrum cordatum]|uniref:Uncharacterized protein n=1 Tax=Prorocentrum cordatum TaxID=2364126 RepID=A0ABN9TNQ1_9DINO|nr:unnamed protein product [Polarella glacialis]
MDTLAKSKSGLEAITEAIVILKAFYAKGAKAISLAQASPVDEDTAGPGFTGNYGGKQVASKGIIGMLAVIKTDFERTIKMTSDSEKKAQADFVEFDRVSRAPALALGRPLALPGGRGRANAVGDSRWRCVSK